MGAPEVWARRVEGSFNSRRWLRWERRCLERASRGDRQAFAALYEAFAEPLFARVLMPRLGNRQAAEDALSETFRTLLERMDRYEDQGVSLWYWLSRVASNKAMDMHRVKQRTARALANFDGLLAPLRERAPQPGELGDAEAELEAVRGAVRTILERINPRYRRAIELRFLEERTREQCAAGLEVKLGTFDVVLLRALRAFRREWEGAFQATGREVVA